MASEPLVHVIDDDAAARDSLAFLLQTARAFRCDTTTTRGAFLTGGTLPARQCARLHHHRRADAARSAGSSCCGDSRRADWACR